MHTCSARIAVVVLIFLSVVTTGCEKPKVTAENFDKISVGMTIAQVRNMLGTDGDDETPSAGYSVSGAGLMGSTAAPENVYVFKSNDLKIIVNVKDGKVVQKSKVDI